MYVHGLVVYRKCCLFLGFPIGMVRRFGHLLGMRLSGFDADLPAGQLGRKTCVLAFLADGQGQLVIVDEGDG